MRKVRTIATTIVTVIAVTLGALAVSTTAAHAEDRSAGDFVSLVNGLRTSRGLAPLTVDPTLAASAQRWTDQMAATATLAHDPALGSAVTGWTKISENVGNGPSVDSIWRAFLASPSHLTNLTDAEVTHLGIGFTRDARGGLWTTHRFIRKAAPVVVPAPVPAPVPTPAPAPAPAPAPVVGAPAATPVAVELAPAPVTEAPVPAEAAEPAEPVIEDHAEANATGGKVAAERVAPVLNALMALD
jgi:hypothetical protein